MVRTSIIIRTRNEQKWLPVLFERLRMQTDQNFEVIVVDSGSTDCTMQIARDAGAHVIEILPKDFSYPHALNVGGAASTAEKFLVILSSHSLPVGVQWLEKSLKNFDDENVAGVYGPTKPLPHATFWDYVFMYVGIVGGWIRRPGRTHKESRIAFGILGFTNAIVRKSLWDAYHFNEAYGAGGEDGDWAAHWMARGKHIMYDRGMMVQHSHNLDFFSWIAQIKNWNAVLKTPRPFHYLSFRRDGAHKPLTK